MPERKDRRLKLPRAVFGGLASAAGDAQVRLLTALTSTVIFGAAAVYRALEGWGWIDAIYFATVTMATVGYGDLAPATDGGKLFTIAYVLVGVGLFVTTAAALAEHVIAHARAERDADAAARHDADRDRP